MSDHDYNRMFHFVCDACGNQWRAYHSDRCPACGAERVWRFPADRKDAADAHAHLVKEHA
jgi:predicted RNA-binding Zn-ribbon protein involved in translation (DUF1610 family)